MNSETLSIASPTSFAALAPDSWFTDRAAEGFWLRIVTPICIPPNDLLELVKLRQVKVNCGAPLTVAFGTLNDFKLPHFHFVAYAAEDGTAILFSHLNELALPTMHAWFFATPLRKSEGTSYDGEARAVLDRASALLQLHLGRNLLRDIVFDGSVNGQSGKISVGSRALRMPDAADGPALHERLWQAVDELYEPIGALPVERRNRLFLSLEFVERAIRHEEEFFHLWTAIELLCNGKAGTIRARLTRALGFADVGAVDRNTGFRTIAAWRHDFVHKGKPIHLTTHVARYMEYMYVDLLRDELGLPGLKLTLQVQSATGFNLTPLGLLDNRVPVEKDGDAGTVRDHA